MAPPTPPLSTLGPFEAACRLRNFTRAADELHYSQATISRRIGELEAHLGVSLFERRRHDVVPTADAEELASAVRTSFTELAAAAERIRRRHQDPSLTIFTDLTLATTVIAPVLGRFQREHPDVDIKVVSSFEPIDETAEHFDVGVQYGRARHTALVVEPVADDAVFPVCAPDVAAELPQPATVHDLLGRRLLHVDYGHDDWTDWGRFFADLGAADATLTLDMVFTSYHVCLDMAERGEGIALGWGRSVRQRIDAGSLVRVAGLAVPVPDAVCSYRPTTARHEAADAFLVLLRDSLS